MTFLAREWELVRSMFANGGRWLIIANFYFAAAIAVLTVVIVITQCSAPDTYAPIQNENPQTVLNENKTVEQGGLLMVEATKCSTADAAITISATSWFQSVDTSTVRVLRSDVHAAIRLPGCQTRTYSNPIPEDLPPGRWQIAASESTRSSANQEQNTGWVTETFTVIEGEHE